MKVEITMPGRPVPWARARSGKGRYFTSTKQRKHRREMSQLFYWEAYSIGRGAGSFTGPVSVSALFVYGKNPYTGVKVASSDEMDWRTCPGFKLEQYQMTSRPDLDNLVKQVLEALQDSGLVKDDSQVVVIHAAKLRERP